MQHFEQVYQRACERHGGRSALDALMPTVRSARALARSQNDRWPGQGLIELFRLLKIRGSRLGGMTGQRILRNMGKDTFIVTGDVVRCLQRSGLDIGDSPGSKRELQLVQGAFNQWHEESELPYSHLSRIAALSV